MKTLIRLRLEPREQSDLGLHYLPRPSSKVIFLGRLHKVQRAIVVSPVLRVAVPVTLL